MGAKVSCKAPEKAESADEGLARRKRTNLGDTSVLELGEHELVVAGKEGAGRGEREGGGRGAGRKGGKLAWSAQDLSREGDKDAPGSVTVVLGGELSAVVERAEVVDKNRRLRSDSSDSLRVRHTRRITKREDVGELGALSRRGVDSDPSGGIGDGRALEEVGSGLGRDDVEEVELAVNGLALARGEGCDLALVVNRDEVVVEETLDVALLTDLLEGGGVLGDTEHGCEGSERLVWHSERTKDGGQDVLGVPVAKTGETSLRTPSLRHCDSAIQRICMLSDISTRPGKKRKGTS
jgi:hypothetical protein